MAIKFGDRLVNINPDYALIDLSDNQTRGIAFFPSGITEANLAAVPLDKRVAGMLGVDSQNDKVYLFTGTQAQANNINLFHIAPLDDDGNPVNQQAADGTADGGTYWEEIGTVERRFSNIPVAIGDGKTFGKYSNSYDHPAYEGNVGVIPVTDIGGGQGMTALEIIIEALSEAQTVPVTLDVYDAVNSVTSGQGSIDSASDPNPDGKFAFGQTSGTVGWTITATNINENLVDDNNDPITLDPDGTSATCSIKYRRRGSNDNFENFVASVNLENTGGNTFTASGSQGWSTSDEYDDFDGFEFRVEVTDTLGMTGQATDSIGVSTYVPPVVDFTAERNTDMSSVYISNEADAHRMPGNVNSTLNWTITPQLQDGLAGSQIQVTGYQILRKTLTTYSGNANGVSPTQDSGWSVITSQSGLSISSGTSQQFTYQDNTVDHAAKFVAYRIVVTDEHLSDTTSANTYYMGLPNGGNLTQNPSNASAATALAYYAAFSESGSGAGGSQACAEMKAPMFWFNANIAGASLPDGTTANNIAGLSGFPTSLPSSFNVTFGAGGTAETLTNFSGAFFSALGVHHANSKKLAVNEQSGPTHGFDTTFNNYTSGSNDGYRLIIAIPDPYGATPSEISEFTTSTNSSNVIAGFQSGLVNITLPSGPSTGGDQLDSLPVVQYRVYVSTNANAFASSQNVTVVYS